MPGTLPLAALLGRPLLTCVLSRLRVTREARWRIGTCDRAALRRKLRPAHVGIAPATEATGRPERREHGREPRRRRRRKSWTKTLRPLWRRSAAHPSIEVVSFSLLRPRIEAYRPLPSLLDAEPHRINSSNRHPLDIRVQTHPIHIPLRVPRQPPPQIRLQPSIAHVVARPRQLRRVLVPRVPLAAVDARQHLPPKRGPAHAEGQRAVRR